MAVISILIAPHRVTRVLFDCHDATPDPARAAGRRYRIMLRFYALRLSQGFREAISTSAAQRYEEAATVPPTRAELPPTLMVGVLRPSRFRTWVSVFGSGAASAGDCFGSSQMAVVTARRAQCPSYYSPNASEPLT
jgi:hypothetical protein